MLKACLNGGRAPGWHPRLPVTPAQLAADAASVAAIGVAAVHCHPRGPGGAESLEPDDCDAVVAAIRLAVPGLEVSLTTIERVEPDPRRRMDQIRGWRILPDSASVNFDDPLAETITALLLERGVGVEAGLSSVADARRWADSGLATRCCRVLVEPDDMDAADAVRIATQITDFVAEVTPDLPQVHHGYGAATWAVIRAALAAGHGARIGLEDVDLLPDGSPAIDNAALVATLRLLADQAAEA